MQERQEKLPASDEVTEVAPDILRMQLPISMPGLGHVNCWALCDDRGLAVVDPGLPGKASWKALEQRLKSAGYKVADVHTVIVTHSHPDHFGGAGMLRHEAGADVVTHASFRTWLDPEEGNDAGPDDIDELDDAADQDQNDSTPPWKRQQPWGGSNNGFKPPLSRRIRFAMYQSPVMRTVAKRWMRAPSPNRRLDDADVVTFGRREWVALHTPGHTRDHLCLYSPADGIVLSGDHVLPTITPHISGLAAGDDSLAQFFVGLERMAKLDGVTLTLPAHGHPFADLAGRAGDIRRHHEERLDELKQISASLGESSVVELSHHLFKPRSWGPMAESETFAHLEHLRLAGAMTHRRVDDQLHYALTPGYEPASTS